MKGHVAFFAFGLIALASPALAQDIVLTEGDSGRPMVIGGDALPKTMSPTALSAADIVAAFAELCTPSPLALQAIGENNRLGLAESPRAFAATDRHGPVTLRHWTGPNASLTLFEGSRDALRGEPVAIVERGYATVSQYGPFRASLPQCNLVITLPEFAISHEIAAELEARFGPAEKKVLRERWADAKWNGLGADQRLAISMTVPQVSSRFRAIHLTAYIEE